MTDSNPPKAPKRKPSHLRSAGKLLSKEARKIVKKHRGRLGDDMADRILGVAGRVDAELKTKDWVELEQQCEALDELLHEYASFARKSALRETVENVGMAVLVALGLRSCLYEPFKIPSPSMVPTLVPGDHIFVNKFRYGIQVPFTTNIVGEDAISGIERGEVVVFRYPLDPSQDYIKRVVGLPGDELKIKDEVIAVKRAEGGDFEWVERKRLDEPCPDDYGEGTTDNCVLFEEDYDGHKYTVRVDRNAPGATRGRQRYFKVPEGHIMVMGDNRRHSADSLQWTRRVEAVFADRLVTDKDLRDITKSRIFRNERSQDYSVDATVDEVTYVAERNSARHDMRLQAWREPSLGSRAVFAAASHGHEPITLRELVERDPGELGQGTRTRIQDASPRFLALATRLGDDAWEGAARLRGSDDQSEVVVHLSCGKEVCPSAGAFARELLAVAEAVEADENRPARELMRRPGGFTYTPKWLGRDGVAAKYFDKSFQLRGQPPGNTGSLRVRAWRQPKEGADLVQRALEAKFSQGRVVDPAASQLGDAFTDADSLRIADTPEGRVVYGSVAERRVLFAVECGLGYCTDEARAIEFAKAVGERAAKAATESKALERLVSREWLESGLEGGLAAKWTASPGKPDFEDLYEWDELSLVSRVRDASQYARVRVEKHAADELEGALAKARKGYRNTSDMGYATGFEVVNAEQYNGYVMVFVEPSTQALVRITCSPELCDDVEGARKLAKRALEKSRDTRNFIDPSFTLDTPFVPRGNVKGRAERIWAKNPEAGSLLPFRLSFDEIR